MSYKPNSYDDDDLKAVVSDFEEMDAQVEAIMAAARGEVSGIRARQKALKKKAKDDLGIPRASLNAVLKTRKLERQIARAARAVPDDEAELYKDMVSVLGDFGDTPLGKAAVEAADNRLKDAEKMQAEEHAEGKRVLDELSGGAS